jgi:hypothetical protein
MMQLIYILPFTFLGKATTNTDGIGSSNRFGLGRRNGLLRKVHTLSGAEMTELSSSLVAVQKI